MKWSDAAAAAAGELLRQQRLQATVEMAGAQRAHVTVHHPGTPDASVTVLLGRVLVYLRSTAAARRFAEVWRDGQVDALRLARHSRRHPGPSRPDDVAEPSMVVHVVGTPAASRWLVELPGQERADHLVIRIDELRLAVYDRVAFESCAAAFAAAHEVAQEHFACGLGTDHANSRDPGASPEAGIDPGRRTGGHPAQAAAAALTPARAPGSAPRRASSLGIRRPRVAGNPTPGRQPGRGQTT